MTRYVDGFLLPVPKANVEAYRQLAQRAGEVWREYGALEYVECVADDVQPGEHTSFPQSVLLKDDETVIFAWITYPSREERDRINAAVMKDPRITCMGPENMPFDGKRMMWGGFRAIVDFPDNGSTA
ncbi:MAG: DUF1428 domain-containing protein [Zoogloeaceae bacterium]|nr:DUF1428 domain-containing protein [Zoogloeaceae bacterium]